MLPIIHNVVWYFAAPFAVNQIIRKMSRKIIGSKYSFYFKLSLPVATFFARNWFVKPGYFQTFIFTEWPLSKYFTCCNFVVNILVHGNLIEIICIHEIDWNKGFFISMWFNFNSMRSLKRKCKIEKITMVVNNKTVNFEEWEIEKFDHKCILWILE